MIARLSELLRYALEKTDVREVPLRQELSFVDAYLEIQQIRFNERLSIDRNVDQDVLEAMVPNLILQPLVENAIQHGIGRLESGGRVEIGAWRESTRLHLTVRGNGPGPAPSFVDGDDSPSFGVGLRNTRDRLESMYGSDYELTLEPADGNGAVAHIAIPFRRRPNVGVSSPTATSNRSADQDIPVDPAN